MMTKAWIKTITPLEFAIRIRAAMNQMKRRLFMSGMCAMESLISRSAV